MTQSSTAAKSPSEPIPVISDLESIRFVFEPISYWAKHRPNHPAVVAEEVQWSYAEFDEKTTALAAAIRSVGVKEHDRVAFILPRGPEAVLLLVAILRSGASYVPLDTASPLNRINDCLHDAQPSLVVLGETHVDLVETKARTISIQELFDLAAAFEPNQLDTALEISGQSLAYIIFTSGTTGRPKGVPITHDALFNFVVGNQAACIQVVPEDRVFQGFSPASDGHNEEVWPTFLAGATLVVGSSHHVHSGQDLHKYLHENKVSIVSCAPTLLSMVEEDLPHLRKILFGAENLPVSMVDRWWKPDRTILNTYGPTEATVGATFGICEPGKPIQIGKPLPGYYCYVLDDQLNEVEHGQEGELAIAGIGVAKGYFGRDDLSATRFLRNLRSRPEHRNEIMYRTGDRVRMDDDGNLVWLGRVDSQVKIRGHRIEVSEIEGHILADPAVQSAVVIARESGTENAHLAALIQLRTDSKLDFTGFQDRLRAVMPQYMVPQNVEIVDTIPKLPSGKVDRGTCAQMHGRAVRIERELVPPRNETEAGLYRLWSSLFGTEDISCTDDFFLDLGGFSLLASRMISTLRSDFSFESASVMDLYENPTIRSLSAVLASKSAPKAQEIPTYTVTDRQYRLAKLIQFFAVIALFGLQAVTWLGPILAAIYFSDAGHSDENSLVLGLSIHVLMVPLLLLFAILVKWVVGGRFKEGDYPVWGTTFLRWWFVQRVLAVAPLGMLTGTPLAPLFLRALGAKVGTNACFESLEIDCPDLIEIGNDCSFENSSWVRTAEVSHGILRLRRIRIGDGCVVGVRSGVSGGGVLEKGAVLRDLSTVGAGTVVPEDQEWVGSPASPAKERELPLYDPSKRPSTRRRWTFAVLQSILVVVLAFAEMFPFVATAFTIYNKAEGWHVYLFEPLCAICLVFVACIQALIVKWLVIGKLKPGTFKYPGFYWLRKWFAEKHLELLSPVIVPVYDSLFTRPWCQALGMKCGPRCEVALPRRMPYDLVEMGEESFLASEVSIGMPFRRNGAITLQRTKVGKRVFLGNDSVVPQGSDIADESLLGVLSAAPPPSVMGNVQGQAWLGSPAFKMPARQVIDSFSLEQTYRPTMKLYVERLAHEAFRVVLPSFYALLIAGAFIEAFVAVWNETSIKVAVFSIPLLYVVTAFVAAAICRLSKRILVGRYTPSVQPLWSRRVWNLETYSAVLHDFGVPTFILPLVGTPMMSGLMRFLGAKVGKRAFIHTTDFTETDLITIGDDTAINANAPLQAHLFEDRVMKIGTIKIGSHCSVGNYSVILCESELRSGSHIGHLSLVMKGETVPANTYWAGSPVQIDTNAIWRLLDQSSLDGAKKLPTSV